MQAQARQRQQTTQQSHLGSLLILMCAPAHLTQLIANGESETLEFKRSTAELRRAGETLCAFLNGEGRTVIVLEAP